MDLIEKLARFHRKFVVNHLLTSILEVHKKNCWTSHYKGKFVCLRPHDRSENGDGQSVYSITQIVSPW